MRKYICWIFVIIFTHLEGGIESHFKSVSRKEAHHFNPIEFVDFAYIINLDQREEKYEHCIQELAPYNISACRFSAVNGWELTLADMNELGVKYEPGMKTNLWGTCYLPEDNFQPHHEIMQVVGRNYFCHCMTRGAIGITLSHLSVLQDALDSGYNTIWVMEDDIEVIKDPHILSRLILELDAYVGEKNWDILFTDRDTKNQNGEYVLCNGFAYRPNFSPANPIRFQQEIPVGTQFRKIGARYGAYSMIIRRSGMEKMLRFLKEKKIFLPYDMEYTLPDDIALYAVNHDIVSTQPRALSDNGAPNYKNKLIITEIEN